MRRLVNIADQMTDPDLAALERDVQPVLEAIQKWVDAREAVRHAGIMEHGKLAKVEATARGEMQRAAMLVVAQARRDEHRKLCPRCDDYRNGKGCYRGEALTAAAEALVERLKVQK